MKSKTTKSFVFLLSLLLVSAVFAVVGSDRDVEAQLHDDVLIGDGCVRTVQFVQQQVLGNQDMTQAYGLTANKGSVASKAFVVIPPEIPGKLVQITDMDMYYLHGSSVGTDTCQVSINSQYCGDTATGTPPLRRMDLQSCLPNVDQDDWNSLKVDCSSVSGSTTTVHTQVYRILYTAEWNTCA